VAVVLADRDEQKSFDDAASLLNYGFAGFTQQTILDQGQQLGAVAVQGWPVPVEAAEGFATLVALRSPGPITSRIIPLHGLRLPVRSGQEVGRILIEVDGRPVGTVRAVASEGIPPPVEAGPHVGSPVSRTPPRDVQRASALVASVLPSLVSAFL